VQNAIIRQPSNSIKYISATLESHISAWHATVQPSLWSSPQPDSIKANFVVAIRPGSAIAGVVVSDSDGNILQAATKIILMQDAAIAEAIVALLAVRLASSCGFDSLSFLKKMDRYLLFPMSTTCHMFWEVVYTRVGGMSLLVWVRWHLCSFR
jgi:hypothetical protein